MKYIYSLYDAKTGELAYKGKAGQLVAAGVFSRSDDVCRLWAKQHLKGIRARKWKVLHMKTNSLRYAATIPFV